MEEELCWEIQTRDRNTEKQLTAKLHHVKSQGTFLSLFPGSRAVLSLQRVVMKQMLNLHVDHIIGLKVDCRCSISVCFHVSVIN